MCSIALVISGRIASISCFCILPSLLNVYSPVFELRFSLDICSFGMPSLYAYTLTVIFVVSNSLVSENCSLSKLLSNAIYVPLQPSEMLIIKCVSLRSSAHLHCSVIT